jgi:hypothetical protein
LLLAGCCLVAMNGWGAETAQHREAVAFLKAFFESPPIVANCVVERRLFDRDGTETAREFFQFRHQPGGYVVRQIPSADPPENLNIPPQGPISGSVEGSVWYYQQGAKVLLPEVAEPVFGQPGQGSPYISSTFMNNVLYWGINGVRPETMEWDEDGRFSGTTRRGKKVEGRILSSVGSKPIQTVRRSNNEPVYVFTDYKYDDPSLGDFPSEIHPMVGTEKGPSIKEVMYKIHVFETNAVPLDNSLFKLEAYYKPADRAVSEIIYTNGVAHRIERGQLVSVELPPPPPGRIPALRVVYAVLVLALTGGLILAWRCFKPKRSLLLVGFFAAVSSVVGAETGQHREAVAFLKEFFESPPIVANCVVERRLFDKDGTETARSFYQFRHQPGGYVVRQIPSAVPPENLNIPPQGPISGLVEGSVWYFQQGVRIRLPEVAKPVFGQPGQTSAYVTATYMHNPLYWGIGMASEGIMEWHEDGRFSGSHPRGKFEGRILSSIGSKPIQTVWRLNGESLHFFTDYKYDDPVLGDFPSEMHLMVGTKQGPSFKEVMYKIHVFETNAVPLDNSLFKLEAYYKPADRAVSEIIYTNGAAHRIERGQLVSVEMPPPPPGRIPALRVVYAVLVLALTGGLILAWRRMRASSR